jgi:hypothetical protein
VSPLLRDILSVLAIFSATYLARRFSRAEFFEWLREIRCPRVSPHAAIHPDQE